MVTANSRCAASALHVRVPRCGAEERRATGDPCDPAPFPCFLVTLFPRCGMGGAANTGEVLHVILLGITPHCSSSITSNNSEHHLQIEVSAKSVVPDLLQR